MKHLYTGILLAALIFLSGCSACETFTKRMSASWALIGPEYRALIRASELSGDTKERRIKASWTVDRVIYEQSLNQELIPESMTFEEWKDNIEERVD